MNRRLKQIGFFAGLTLLSVWFMWPIYQDTYLVITVASALALGFGAAWWKQKRNLGPLSVLGVLAGLYLVFSFPLANPRALGNPTMLLPNLLETLEAPAIAWKQLLTIELPVGTYHALLAPAFLAYLIAGFIIGWVYLGVNTRYWAIAYAFLGLVILSISFGVTTVPGDFGIFGFFVPVATPFVSGTAIFALLVWYLNWGARQARTSALSERSSSKSTSASYWQRRLKRGLQSFAVIGVAILVTGYFMNTTGMPVTRIVLRTDVQKTNNIAKQASPLSSYRMYFNNSALLTGTILTYSKSGAPDRIRIATMPYYNGDTFTVAPTKASDTSGSFLFSRVPSDLPPTSSGTEQTTKIKLGLLDSIWIPLVAGVRRVEFSGSNSALLSDSLFVNRATDTGAVVPGRSTDATYSVTYNRVGQPDPTTISPSASSIDTALIPDSLNTWLDNQTDLPGGDGKSILDLANRLRERGYLSHSFVKPTTDKAGADWISALSGNYEFSQSNAGHNLNRIDLMLNDLNARQLGASSGQNLVSTAGDDEQFATAIALIAAAKGYPSRVVVGFRTNKLPDLPGIPSCQLSGAVGVCKGENISAWAEIQGSNGQWLAIDSTPQYAKAINQKPIGQAYTPNPTGSGDSAASQLPPAKASPSTDAYCQKHPQSQQCVKDTTWEQVLAFINNFIVPALEGLGVGIVIFGPFALIILMKRNRQKRRRSNPKPETNLLGAWEEYIDLLVDNGADFPANKTRLELSRHYGAEGLVELANMADLASFSPRMPTQEEIDRAWQIFDAKQSSVYQESSKVKVARATISLKSFLRVLDFKTQISKLRSGFSFGSSKSSGSSFKAFLIELRRQILALFSKK